MALTHTQFGYRCHPDQDRVGADVAEHAVVVVGAGPVGLSLAIDLAPRGQPVVLPDDAGAAVAEAQWARDAGLRGILLPSLGASMLGAGLPSLGGANPVLDVVAALVMVLLFSAIVVREAGRLLADERPDE